MRATWSGLLVSCTVPCTPSEIDVICHSPREGEAQLPVTASWIGSYSTTTHPASFLFPSRVLYIIRFTALCEHFLVWYS